MADRREFVKAALAALPAVKAVEALRLKPGDVVVLKVPESISAEAQTRIAEQWKRVCSEHGLGDVPAVVLTGGIDIAVLERDK